MRSREEKDLMQAVVPAGAPITFPDLCVCCLDPNVRRRDLSVDEYFTFDLGISGGVRRRVNLNATQTIPLVPYCAMHMTELEGRLARSEANAEAMAETSGWQKFLLIGVPAIVGLFLGAWVWPKWGWFIGAMIGLMGGALALGIIEQRRGQSLVAGAPELPSSALPKEERPAFYAGWEGVGGTLGFRAIQRARLEDANTPAPRLIVMETTFDFQRADYARLFRERNGFDTPRAAKAKRKGRAARADVERFKKSA